MNPFHRIEFVCLVALLGLLQPGSARGQVPESAQIVEESSLRDRQVDQTVENLQSSLNIPSMAIAIFNADRTLYRHTSGEATPDSRFYAGSLSKAITATLVMRLVESDDLELDTPARDYVSFDLPNYIQLADLLQHRSGIPRIEGHASWSGGSENFEKHAAGLNLEPGPHEFEYSNLNYEIVGRIVEVVTQSSYSEALQKHLLDPLDLEQTHAAATPGEIPNLVPGRQYLFGPTISSAERPYYEWEIPSRFVATSLRDAVRLGQLHLAEGRAGNSRLLKAEHVRQMGEPPEEKAEHAMGWFVETHAGERMLRHEGFTTSYRASMALLPDRGIGAIALSNVNSFGANANGALTKNLALMAAGEPTETLTNLELMLRIAAGVLTLSLVVFFVLRLVSWGRSGFRFGLLPGAWRRILPAAIVGGGLVLGVPWYFGTPLLGIWKLQPDLFLTLVLVPLLGFLSILLGEVGRFTDVESPPIEEQSPV